MRTTLHSGRRGDNGNYSARHNDRQFDLDKAEHIDQSKVADNWYWHRYKNDAPELTFEEAEKRFYADYFTKHLDAQNAKYIANRHAERCKTMDEYYKSKCPEETILQIGKMNETVDKSLLQKIYVAHVNWMQKAYPQVMILDAALHVDEEGAPHIHERRVWVAHDKNNNLIVSQEKSLNEMGVQRPDLTKSVGRYNNAKQTFTQACREHFQAICKEHGIDLEVEPQEASRTGLKQLEYKRQQEQAKHDELVKDNKEVSTRLSEAQEGLEHTLDHIKDLDIVQNTVKLDIRTLEDIERIQQEQARQQTELLDWQHRLQQQETKLQKDKAKAQQIIRDRESIIAKAYDDRKISLDEMLNKGINQMKIMDMIQKYYPEQLKQLAMKANEQAKAQHIQQYRDKDWER